MSHHQNVFLSYCPDDGRLPELRTFSEIVRRKAAKSLRFRDIDDKHVELADALKAEIDKADIVVIVLSDRYKICPHCKTEAIYILNYFRRAFIPILITKEERPIKGWLGFSIAGKKYVDIDHLGPDKAAISLLLSAYEYLSTQQSEHDFQAEVQKLNEEVQRSERTFSIDPDEPFDPRRRKSSVSEIVKSFSAINLQSEPSVVVADHEYETTLVGQFVAKLSEYKIMVRRSEAQSAMSVYEKISTDIELHDVVVVLISDSLKASESWRQALFYARKLGKLVIPVRLQPGCLIDDWLGNVIGQKNPIEFDNQDLEGVARQIVETISKEAQRPPIELRHSRSPVAKDEADFVFEPAEKTQVYVTHCDAASEILDGIKKVIKRLHDEPSLEVHIGKVNNDKTEIDRDKIAKLIEASHMAVFFLTKDAVQCSICKREIDYNLSLKRPYFIVAAEPEWDTMQGSQNSAGVLLTAARKNPVHLEDAEETALKLLLQMYDTLVAKNKDDVPKQAYFTKQLSDVRDQYQELLSQRRFADSDDDSDDDVGTFKHLPPTRPSLTPSNSFSVVSSGDVIKVFISYSWTQKDIVRHIAEMLAVQREIKLDIWIDVARMNQTIYKCMESGILNADLVVMFYSDDYKKSENAQLEAAGVFNFNKPVIPVQIQRDCPLDGRLGVRLAGKQTPIPFGTAEEITRQVLDRILFAAKKKAMKADVPPDPTNLRPIDFNRLQSLKDKLLTLCSSTAECCQTLLICGERDVGKTTMIAHLINSDDYERFLFTQCNIRFFAWIDCEGKDYDEAEFMVPLVKAFRRALKLDIVAWSTTAINTALSETCQDDADSRFLLVLDNVKDKQILAKTAELSSAVRCVAISHDLTDECLDGSLVTSVLKIIPPSELDTLGRLREMIGKQQQTDENAEMKLKTLALKCHEIPNLMNLLQSRFDANGAIPQQMIDAILENKHYEDSYTPQQVALFVMQCYFDSDKTDVSSRARYVSLLFFEPRQHVNIRDLACLWELGNDLPKAFETCTELKRLALLKQSTEDDLNFHLDEVLFESLLNYARQMADLPSDLAEIRSKLISPRTFRQAIKAMRKDFLCLIIRRLTGKALEDILLNQTLDHGRTVLHLLLDYREQWRQCVGTSAAKSVAIQLMIDVLEALSDPLKMLTVADHSGECPLLQILESKSKQPEFIRLIHLVESYGAHRVKPFCLELRYWKQIAEKLTGNGSHALILAALQDEVESFEMALAENPTKINVRCEPSGETALTAASARGNLKIVQLLLEHGANVETANCDCRTALMRASFNGHVEIVKLLLAKGANVNVTDVRTKETAITLASQAGHREIVELLLENGASLAAKSGSRMNAFYYAIQNGHTEIVDLLLQKGGSKAAGFDVNWGFRYAATNGHLVLAQRMLALKAQLEVAEVGVPILCIASANGHGDIVKLLIANRVNVEQRDSQDFTPLMHAVRHGHLPIVEMLVEAGAKVGTKRKTSATTALFYAVEFGYMEVAKYLVAKGASIKDRKDDGTTPLMRAVEADQRVMVEFLLQLGADLNTKDNSGSTPISVAVNTRNPQMVKFLAEKGANVNTVNGNKQSLLILAAKNGFFDVAETLLQCGANVNQRDRFQCSALHYAIKGQSSDHYNIAKMLKNSANIERSILESISETMKPASKTVLPADGKGIPPIFLKNPDEMELEPIDETNNETTYQEF